MPNFPSRPRKYIENIPDEMYLEYMMRSSNDLGLNMLMNWEYRKHVGFLSSYRDEISGGFDVDGEYYLPLVYYTAYDNYHCQDGKYIDRHKYPIVNPHKSFITNYVYNERLDQHFALTFTDDVTPSGKAGRKMLLQFDKTYWSQIYDYDGKTYEHCLKYLLDLGEEHDGKIFKV